MEEERVWQVLGYVELNPVRAGMVENAWDWEWSSARAHVTGSDSSGLLDMSYWRRTFNEVEWRKFLEQLLANEAINKKIRRATAGGYFGGNDATARRLEQELGKQLLPGRRGRKPKGAQSKLGEF